MSLFVHPIEGFWFITNAVTLLLTAVALVGALGDRSIAKLDRTFSHEARKLTARGNVRRETLRVVVQLLLISIVLPGLFTDRPVTLSPPVIALILVPVVLLVSTVADSRERAQVSAALIALVHIERESLALETSVQTGLDLTREAGVKADAAYEVANDVNHKLAALTELVGGRKTSRERPRSLLPGTGMSP